LTNPICRIRSEAVQNNLINQSAGVAQKGIYLNQLSEIEIPLPSLEVQKQIVARITREQTYIESAKLAAQLFEQKIKSEIAEIWNG
jgi:restriction endonuclease S subunit